MSSGTISAEVLPEGPKYESGALVPAVPWRRPTARERLLLEARAVPREPGSAISVVSNLSILLRPFAPLRRAAERGAAGEINRFLARTRLNADIAALADRLCARLHAERGQDFGGGIISHPPGQTTVTEHPDSRCLVGLHLDNWYEFPLERRARSPNRICINLGAQDRFFLFLNIPIADVYRRIKDRLEDISPNSRGTLIARAFLKIFPTYPIVRLRVRPGEAYIAPTENVIHDGSTFDMTVPDVNLSLRGRLPLVFQRSFRGIK